MVQLETVKVNWLKERNFLEYLTIKTEYITEGSIFHVETYGLNAMGSHANQLSAHERWLVADYVLKLKSQL